MEDVKLPRIRARLKRSWGVCGPNGGPKRWPKSLNNSVLIKMPRDYTDPNAAVMYSPRSARVSHTMQKNKNNKASRSGRKSRKQKQRGAKTESFGGAPSAYNVVRVTGVPRMIAKPSADARITVKHQEYMATVNGSVTELTTLYEINPGLATNFPWLSGIAKNYETYCWKSLQFEYVPQVGTQTKGRVMMAADYDAADTAVSTYKRLGSMHGAVNGSIWSVVRLSCDSSDLKKMTQRYVRTGSVPSGKDIKTYDALSLMVNVGGTSDTAVYGDIRVSYVIELMTPQVESDDELLSSKLIANTNPTLAAPFSATVAVTGGLDIVPDSVAALKFGKVGEYLLSGYMSGTGMPGTHPTWTVTSGSGVVSNKTLTVNGAATEEMWDQYITVNTAPMLATFAAGAAALSGLTMRYAKYDTHL